VINEGRLDGVRIAVWSSRARSAIDWFFGLRLSRTPTSPNWSPPSTSATRLSSSVLAATAKFTARVVRPTPPLGAKNVTTCPGRGAGVGVSSISRRWCRSGRAIHLLTVALVNLRIEADSSSDEKGLTRNSRAPASMAGAGKSGSPWTLIMMIDVAGARTDSCSAVGCRPCRAC
jgi:hypothetical protein